jgi:Flagellar-associated PapD-like
MLSNTVSQSGSVIKKSPSKLIEDQLSGKSLSDIHRKPEIIQFLNIADYSIYPNTNVPLDEPLFKPEPTVIQFYNYEPQDTKTFTLMLRNKDCVSRRVKIIPPDSRLFYLLKSKTNAPVETGTKVAPGMVTEFVIQFTPEAKVDYSYDLVVVTEREKFIVPIRCQGQRAMVSFPDAVNFGVCPVKHPTEKPVIIRNVGEKPTKWVLKIPPPFSAEKTEGFLEVGQVDQVILKFHPQESRNYEEEIILSYDTLSAYIKLLSEAQNDPNVYLSKTFIDLKKAYITLSSQDTFKIINKSEVPNEFEWRAFTNEQEEQEKKNKLLMQLSQEEAEERMIIEENLEIEDEAESLDSDDSYDDMELKSLKERKLQRALAALEWKYLNIRKAVEDDLMLFQDDIFKIEPQRGKIWPNSELEITVTFCPQSALHYTCTAYCNVTCSEERLQLTLEAIGIGPEAILSTTEYDIGDVFVNDNKDIPHIFIENQGAIEAKYTIIPSDTPFGSKFIFEHYEGILGTSEYNRKQPLRIKFCSDLMGEFSETFKIKLSGSSDELSLTLKGHVMPPSFNFDKEEINFGEVSYQFPYSEIVRIRNTSRVGFTYHIRVPGDSSSVKKEFEISPDSGYLKPRDINNIQIDFMPMTVKKYDMVLVVDVEGVGPDMHTLPIKAECSTPKVELIPSDIIDFGSVFLRHPYDYHLEMKNKSKLQAKFEILPQDEQNSQIAIYSTDREEGFIEPKSSGIIKIKMNPQKAGHIRIPMHVKILGDNNGQPHMITLVAFCTGPIVSILTPELDFGKVKVLEDYPLKITLHNKSDIEAEYTAFTKNRNSCFSVVEKEGKLLPGEIRDVTVVCCADECIGFNEILHIVIKEGEDVDVILKARGTGTTAFCETDIKSIDFGTIFTCRSHNKRFTIQNRGRKPQKLKWNRINQRGNLVPILDSSKIQNTRVVSANTTNISNNKDKDKAPEVYVFSVNPITVLLQPKTQITFEFFANSSSAGNISENLTCTSLVGSERKEKIVFECNLKGQFIDPFLQFTENTVFFKYVWQKGMPIEPLSKEIEITCVALLPANFLLKCTPPFSINKERFELEPGQSKSLRIDFDPGHKYDKTSGQTIQKLQIIHQDHPQKDTIELIGEVCFPNLKMETTNIDFSCILNDTTKKVYMKMTNCSILEVIYNWNFVQEIIMGEEPTENSENINQLFDILPVKGKLRPGESETVEFLYHASSGLKHKALAVCDVDGGPEYEINLTGESSEVNYSLSRYAINFGDIPYNESSVQEFFVENKGKVPFEYSINLDSLKRPGILEVAPAQGKVGASEKAKVSIKITPGIPDSLEEVIEVEIAHYDPILLRLTARGIYPALLFHLPRPDDLKHGAILDQLREQNNISQNNYESILQSSKNESKTGRDIKFDNSLVKLEAEADRIEICNKLTRAIDKFYLKNKKKTPSEEKSLSAIMTEVQEKIIGAVWECNFGNMVLGKDKVKYIRVANVGELPVLFAFDMKQLKLNGITIEPTKFPKLEKDESRVFTVKFQSNKKTMHFGPIKIMTNIEVKNGLNYQLVFKANLTTPDFSMSSDVIDFGKVMVGTISIAKIRIENIREVPCEWNYVSKHPNSAVVNKDAERFQVNPASGLLQPGQKFVIDVIFTPIQEKVIGYKIEFKITNNQTNKFLTVKGIGISQNIEFIPSKVVLGPVLPYSKEAFTLIEMKNTTENPVEVYSLDYDSKYREEEEMLRAYEGFESGTDEVTISQGTDVPGTQRKEAKIVYMTPRKPGMPLWKEVVTMFEKRQKKIQQSLKDKEMEDKIKSENEEDKKIAEEYFKNKNLEVEETKMVEEKYPNFIPEKDRHNVIVWGVPGRGKSFLAMTLAEKHSRALLSLNGILEWHIQQNTQIGDEIQKFLALQAERKEKDIQEREKLKKARKKVDDIPFDEKIYKHIPIELFEKAIKERIKSTDCNAGAIIDDLKCDYQPNSLTSVQILSKIFSSQNLQLLIINENAESVGEVNDENDLLVFKDCDVKDIEQFNKEKDEISNILLSLMVNNDMQEANPDSEYGKRLVNEITSTNKKSELIENALEIVPFPVFPDPDTLPLPQPQVWQIVSKPRNRQKPTQIVGFSLHTPINQTLQEGNEDPIKRIDLSEENLDRTKGRWIVDGNSSYYLLLKFFSIDIGSFDANLQFEIVGCSKHFALPCLCVCQFPTVNTDPRNVFMKRKKSRPIGAPDCYVSKHYISQEGKYEFGPLLIGKLPDKKYVESVKKTNAESFRITNNGLYPINIDFALRSCIGSEKKSAFIYEPESMKLGIDETGEITVWAFPDGLGEFTDTLLALIEGNPKPVAFPLSCQGEKPIAEADPELIVFERILLKQTLTKSITVKNTGRIPLKWNLGGIDLLPEEFEKDKTGGTLKPCETATVNLTFKAIKQFKFHPKVNLEVTDTENIGIKQDPKVINIEAEAFDVKVNINFGNDKNLIDFKDVKVFDEVTQQINLTNSGIYDVKYNFLVKKKIMKDIINFTPPEGLLTPNQTQPISVVLKTDKERKIDPAKESSDIKLMIMEGASGEKCEELPINIALNAIFSKYSIHPLRNINFGPLQYGDNRTRTFEIRNEGIFDFDYTITELIDERLRTDKTQRKQSPKEEQKNKAKDALAKKPPVDPKKVVKGKEAQSSIEIGQFTISPSAGTISKANSVVISITFNAEGSKLYQKTIAINISNRDPLDNPLGIPYDLGGESCIPGVNTWDFDMIFEEQTVIPSLSITHTQKIITSKVFAQEENVFLFGTQVSSKNHEGVFEKFKIMNCSKVPANVNFTVKPRTASKSEGFGFEVTPQKVHILPHGYEYVKVTFKPIDMIAYGAIFEAVVEGGDPNPKTHKLSFELRGEGTLPTVSQQGAVLTDDGKSMIRFPKTKLGKTSKIPITLVNGGLIPATVKFEMELNRCYKFSEAMIATLQAKSSMAFHIEFKPEESQKFTHEFKMITVNNPYELQVFSLNGEGYQEDIMFEGLEDKEDECFFGDCIVGQEKEMVFSLHNNCDNPVKFEWAERPNFNFVPSCGHLASKASKSIKLIFKADEPQNHKSLELMCQTIQINQSKDFEDWDNSMFDVRFVTQKQFEAFQKKKEEEEKRKKEEFEAAQKKGGIKKTPAPPKKREDKKLEIEEDAEGEATIEIQETRKEPNYQEIDKTQKQVVLKVTAIADFIRYSCDYQEIRFASTLMFATRSFKFPLRNACNIGMPYKFKICSATTGRLDAGPYSVAPREGTIQPGCDEVVTVKFSPNEVDSLNERLLVCSLNNLAPDLEPLVIELKGKSSRPICHFELPPTNYREKKSQESLQIDSSYQILEFESMGTKVKNTKRFYVVNPTNQGYEFEWEPEEKEGAELALKQFKCLTMKGVILSGKKYEMVFEYTPEFVGTHESFWRFRIPTEKIIQNFFVVGSVLEPLILLEKGMINFNQLLLGGKATEAVNIINQEIIPFVYTIEKDSLKADEGAGDDITVSPMTGVVPPQGSFRIDITFQPRKDTKYNFNVVVNIKRKARPLVLNVKGVGYVISHSVHYENSHAALLTDDPCNVNFGSLFVNESQKRTVQIINSGKFNFDYSWKKSNKLGVLLIVPEQGTVRSGETVNVELKYLPSSENDLKGSKLFLNIVSGPKYTFVLQGSSRKPGVHFSFNEKDFGPCFVLRTLMPKTEMLEIINYDNSAISIETNFEKLPHLDVQLAPGQVLLPTTPNDPDLEKKKLIVPIIFTPREIMTYNNVVVFDINNVMKFQVVIKGEGTQVKLELASRDQETVDFGVSRVGVEKTKTVQLTNKSKRSINLTLVDGSGMDELKKHAMFFSPDTEISLKPKQTIPIEIGFKPKERLPPFTENLLAKFSNGETKKILSISGVCYGIELKLMEEVVSFGNVIIGSHQSKKAQLLNIGDIPCTFQWDNSKYKESFTILPESGTIQANTEIYFEVTFHPKAVATEIRISKVQCNIQGADPLFLTLQGSSIPPPPESTKELVFDPIVRETKVQKVQVKNPTTFKWRIQPSLSANPEITKNYWAGASSLEIQPGATADYEIAYTPLTMTNESQHEGTLFFPLPDGTALVFKLTGIAKPPKPMDVIVKEIKAKVPQVLILPVKNWLEVTQRFEVKWELEGEQDPAILIRGANTIDAPGYTTKEYKLNFLTYKTGTTKFKVTFTNPSSKEYLFFNLEMKALQQELQGTIELICPVREVIQKVIMIANPLSNSIEITKSMISCDNDYVLIEPEWLEIPAKSESGIEVTYRPLVATESSSKLVIKTPQLGEFNYILVLKGTPSASQRTLNFSTSLGTELVQAFRFTHYLKKLVQYSVKIEKAIGTGPADFITDKPICEAPANNSWDGIEITLPVRFEPSNPGESRAILTLTHPEAGEFTCVLSGTASAPMPQGPFKCIPGKGIGIEFRNPFYEPMEYLIRLDNPSFTISAKSPVKLDSKKSISIQVVYKPQEGKPTTGRMIITTGDLPPWIYYLSGE